ncbi:MAG: hypothetical protein GX568_00810 [Candidatus Gastranaerophilales bacterium]|nr:hypothetical protein [Candidatus Gastranaerophilales bacterium]
MEYVQELEILKNEINKSGRKIEDLSDFLQNFPDINSLQEVLKGIQNNDVFSRIESKIDILAQSDAAEIVNIIINELREDLDKKYAELVSKVDKLEKTEAKVPEIIVSKELTDNYNELRENISGLEEQIGKMILAVGQAWRNDQVEQQEQKEQIADTTEKLSLLISMMQELRQDIPAISQAAEDEMTSALQEVPKTEFISEKIAKVTALFEQVQAQLSDDSFETDVKQNFASITENFGRIEQILGNIGAFEGIRDEICLLNQNIAQIKEQINNNFTGEEILASLGSINENIEIFKENLPQKAIFEDIKEGFTGLSAKVLEVYENLYPLQNLQTVTESFQSAQDKLNIIIEKLDRNSVEKIEKTLDLDNRFDNIQSKMDASISGSTESIKNKLNELIQQLREDTQNNDKTEELNSIQAKLDVLFDKAGKISEGLESGNSLNEQARGDLKYLHLKTDSIKELLDRLIRFNGSDSEKTENSINEIKQALLFINRGVAQVKETSEQAVSSDAFKEAADLLTNKIDTISEKLENKTELEAISGAINALSDKIASIEGKLNDNAASAASTTQAELEAVRETLAALVVSTDSINEEQADSADIDAIRQAIGTLSGKIDSIGASAAEDTKIESVSSSLDSVRQSIDSLGAKIEEESISAELREGIYNLQNLGTLNENFQAAQDTLNMLVETVIRQTPEYLRDEMGLENGFKNIHFKIDSQVMTSLSAIRECISELKLGQNGSEDIKNALYFLKNNLDEISQNLKYSRENNISEETLKSLIEDINSIKKSTENTGIDGIELRLGEISATIELFGQKISTLLRTDQFARNIELVQESISQLEEKFNYTNEKISEFANLATSSSDSNISAIHDHLNSVNDSLLVKLNMGAEMLNGFLGEFSNKIDNILGAGNDNESSEQLKQELAGISQAFSAVYEKISTLCKEVHPLKDISQKIESIDEQMKFASSSEEIKELNEKIDYLAEEIKAYRDAAPVVEQHIQPSVDFSEVLAKIGQLSAEFRQSLNFSEEFDSLEDGISGINNRIDELNCSVQAALHSLQNSNSSKNVDNKLDNLENSVESGLGSVNNNIEEVKSISSRMAEDVEALKNTVSDLFDVLGNPENQEENAEQLKNLNSAIERVENFINSTDKTAENKFDELKQASKEISDRIAAISNTLSNELSADISGGISEASKQIQKKLDKLLELANAIEAKASNENAEEIMNLLRAFSEANEVRQTMTNETLDGFKQEFSSLVSELSSYNSDMTDIHSKINKLIINSDNNSDVLREKINESLKNLKEDLRRAFESNSKNVHSEIEKLNTLSQKGLASSDTVKDALLQMAEWIDSAGQLLEENNTNSIKNLTGMDNVSKNIISSGKNILEQINRVQSKFENFEVRLESIEAKIERLENRTGQEEIKEMLREIINKVGVA